MRLASDDPIEVHPLLGGLPLADSTWAAAQMRPVVLHEGEVLRSEEHTSELQSH